MNHAALNGLCNAVSGEARTFNYLAAAIFAALNKPPRVEYFEMPETLRSSYKYFTQADIAKIQSAGYDASPTEFEGGVQRYVERLLAESRPGFQDSM